MEEGLQLEKKGEKGKEKEREKYYGRGGEGLEGHEKGREKRSMKVGKRSKGLKEKEERKKF